MNMLGLYVYNPRFSYCSKRQPRNRSSGAMLCFRRLKALWSLLSRQPEHLYYNKYFTSIYWCIRMNCKGAELLEHALVTGFLWKTIYPHWTRLECVASPSSVYSTTASKQGEKPLSTWFSLHSSPWKSVSIKGFHFLSPSPSSHVLWRREASMNSHPH